jgi:glyoxylate reductase
MSKVYVTRRIPDPGLNMLKDAGYEVIVSEKDGVLTREELLNNLQETNPDAIVGLLTDEIDGQVFDAAPNAKIFANYAVGFNNINIEDAKARGVTITNTPGVLTETVAEHAMAMIFAITMRIAEGDRFTRAGRYDGWAPMLLLGVDLNDKTLGVLGAGRIGQEVARIANQGVGMKIIYFDVARNEEFESKYNAEFRETPEEVLKEADVVTIHVPLLDSTHHLINAERLSMMKPTAYLVNTSRGPVIDEAALVEALRNGTIKGAALDVFENEPQLAEGLADLENIVITPHIASATVGTRGKMAEIAAQNVIDFLEGKTPPNVVEA